MSSRRAFLRNATATAAAWTLGGGSAALALQASRGQKDPLVGIQIDAHSLFDEGINKVLDVLQEQGQVNTLCLAAFTFDTATGGRSSPYPGHGKRDADKAFHGGNFAMMHEKYYHDTVLRDVKAPEYRDRDILAEVIPETRKRGMKVYAWDYNVFRRDTPHIEQLEEEDIDGNKANTLCAFNPNYRSFIAGLVEDQCRSYDLDGVMWGDEHQGPFDNAIDASIQRMTVTCFCKYHCDMARKRGIDPDRAKEGYRKLMAQAAEAKRQNRPNDGYFVSFWRLCVDYPELLAWEKLWNDGKYSTFKLIYDTAKTVRQSMQVGFHIWHTASFSPFFRAEQNFAEFATYADFIKPVLYNECAGGRDGRFLDNIHNSVFGDLPVDELYHMQNEILGYEEKPLPEVMAEGFSADYVYRETKRTLNDVKGACKVYPGIGIDIPNKFGSTPERVHDATLAAFRAGAQGVIFSREYAEMHIENLAGGGKAIRSVRSS
jgi:hypothetical protein